MSLTLIIIIVTVIASMAAWKNSRLFSKWMMHPYTIHQNKQYYRLVTSGFVHGGYGHLAFNMITFYFFGSYVEKAFGLYFGIPGDFYFLMLYLLGIVVADLPSYWKNRTNVNYSAIGASGGVSAVLFSSILLNPLNQICLYIFICFPGFILGAVYLFYTYYKSNNLADNINHDAHLYGALFGMVFTAILRPRFLFDFIDQLSHFSLFN